MASFPTLSFGASAKAPVTRTLVCPSKVERFADNKEQRYKAGTAYWRIQFPLTNLSAADRDAVTTFFNDQKGMYATDWDITLDQLYDNCRFEMDELEWREDRPMRFSATIRLTSRM